MISTITAFDVLGDRFTKSVPFDGHTYVLSVKLHTPIEEIALPTELGVMVARTTTAKSENEGQEMTDIIVSGTVLAAIPDTEEVVTREDQTEAEAPLVDELEKASAQKPKQEEVIEILQETIPVTWEGDRVYTPEQNSKVIYTAVLPEGYDRKEDLKLPQIHVMVGRQARAGGAAVMFLLQEAIVQQAPYATLAKAFADVNAGGTVYLMSDITVYSTITLPTKTVTLQSVPGNQVFTIYRGSKTGSVLLVSNASTNLTLANIILDGQSGIDGLGGWLLQFSFGLRCYL